MRRDVSHHLKRAANAASLRRGLLRRTKCLLAASARRQGRRGVLFFFFPFTPGVFRLTTGGVPTRTVRMRFIGGVALVLACAGIDSIRRTAYRVFVYRFRLFVVADVVRFFVLKRSRLRHKRPRHPKHFCQIHALPHDVRQLRGDAGDELPGSGGFGSVGRGGWVAFSIRVVVFLIVSSLRITSRVPREAPYTHQRASY